MPAKTIGRCIVADPAIDHSEPTFRATYASSPADVLEQVESGMAEEAIIERHGRTGRGTAYVLKGSNDSLRTFGNDENKWQGDTKVNKSIKDIKPILDEAKERLQNSYIEDLTTDYPIPSSDRVLLFSRFPDREFDKVSSKIGDSSEDIYSKTSDVLIKYLKLTESEKIIITSDHGYCTKHSNATWKVPAMEKEIYQEVFSLARFKKRSEIFGDMESKVKEVKEKTGRLKTVNGYILTNGRYIWHVMGDKKNMYYGGIPFMENFVPLIVVNRM